MRFLSVVSSVAIVAFCSVSFATTTPQDYTIHYHGWGCIMDPDDSGPFGYSAFGVYNDHNTDEGYFYCPVNYIRTLTVENDTQTYNPTSDQTEIIVRVMDNHSSDEVKCKILATDTTGTGGAFNYSISSSWVGSGSAATEAADLTIDVDSDLGSYDSYLTLYCYVPDKESYVSRILGYSFSVNPS